MLRRARSNSPLFALVAPFAPFALFLTTCAHSPRGSQEIVGVTVGSEGTTASPVRAPEASFARVGTRDGAGEGRETREAPQVSVASTYPQIAPTPTALWTERLDPIHVYYANTEDEIPIRLYAPDGSIDPNELAAFRRIVANKGAAPAPMNSRLVQLVMKAAYHFGAHSITVVSAYRPGRSAGKHATGEAIDFKLKGVNFWKIASYIRHFPRAGVGIYTDPGTQYVHLDVRDESYHWRDASPPGKHWHEKKINDPTREERDAAYTPESDLPLD